MDHFVRILHDLQAERADLLEQVECLNVCIAIFEKKLHNSTTTNTKQTHEIVTPSGVFAATTISSRARQRRQSIPERISSQIIDALSSAGRCLLKKEIKSHLLSTGVELSNGDLQYYLKCMAMSRDVVRVRYNHANRTMAYALPIWIEENQLPIIRHAQDNSIDINRMEILA